MTLRRKKRWPFFLLISFSVTALAYQALQVRVAGPDVRQFAEAKAREILRSDVRIGKIRYHPPAAISLEKIEILSQGAEPSSAILQVDRLLIGYDFFNLIRRNFRIPGRIEMVRPKIQFTAAPSQPPFMDSNFSFSEKAPTTLIIKNGEFRYPWRGGELLLQKVNLEAKPTFRGEVRLRLAAEVASLASGTIEVEGKTDPTFRRYDLHIQLDDVSFLPESQIPVRELDGKFRLSEKTIQTDGASSFLHDWEVEWKGRIENWQADPQIVFDLNHKKGQSPFRLSGKADFASQELSGEWVWLGQNYPFQGKVVREGEKIIFPLHELPQGYSGRVELDHETGDYGVEFHREKRRFQIRSNLNRLDFKTEFQLDHALINHLDWVVLGRIALSPLPRSGGDDPIRFKGNVQTDYFIIEYEPLEDFQGSFELDEEGIQAVNLAWGGKFNLEGRLLFKGGKPRQDFIVRVENFLLESTNDFGKRPLPQNLKGGLEGRLKLRGEWSRPEIQGYFTIKDGQIEKLDFDRAVIQFRGFAPYLKLYDSKIFRGRTTLAMQGAINLNLKNIFRGVQIKGPDHLVIWKGVSAFWKEGESAIEAEKPLTKQVSVGLEVGTGRADSQTDDPDESHAVLGPKVRF